MERWADIHSEELVEKAKLSGSHTVEKGETGDLWWAGKYEEANVRYWPRKPPRAMSVSMVLVCVYVCGMSYHQSLSRWLWSGLPPETICLSKGCASMGGHVDLSGLYCHQNHWNIWAQCADGGHVLVHGPMAARVCVDAPGTPSSHTDILGLN